MPTIIFQRTLAPVIFLRFERSQSGTSWYEIYYGLLMRWIGLFGRLIETFFPFQAPSSFRHISFASPKSENSSNSLHVAATKIERPSTFEQQWPGSLTFYKLLLAMNRELNEVCHSQFDQLYGGFEISYMSHTYVKI